MSNEYNEAILENLFEEGLELYKGDEKKAEKYARKKFEELPEPDYKEDGGDVKRPTPTYKSMDMGGDILDSYLAGLGNSKDTTIKGGGSKKKPKPINKAKGGAVSPRKAQGMYRG